ncbi:hypothetical protein [Fibrella forsythiae]|uniref:Uncharacterized protein n=1 Tax=Fibrella forsythiae TaxID=2817061 RepID=A0ABS3JAQ2_9BACT|nr:hypothetical protein [Fibrella forsythiae]MBO0947074.1 hypothetical protein [Fibrella forsythiae]
MGFTTRLSGPALAPAQRGPLHILPTGNYRQAGCSPGQIRQKNGFQLLQAGTFCS